MCLDHLVSINYCRKTQGDHWVVDSLCLSSLVLYCDCISSLCSGWFTGVLSMEKAVHPLRPCVKGSLNVQTKPLRITFCTIMLLHHLDFNLHFSPISLFCQLFITVSLKYDERRTYGLNDVRIMHLYCTACRV